ncbi:glutathione S-transferase C-terminal domain-containing protein homolog [Haematobia irritans]|uniref:glutathione S-transferase C-terminal domain-containing protein homolog n=1 Tax=Haematobia irritans TaxID=7368 RepID=UPI003F50CDFA
MVDKLYVEIYNQNGYETTVKSFTALHVYYYLEKPKNIKLYFVLSKNIPECGRIKLNYDSLKPEVTDNLICKEDTKEQAIWDLDLPLYIKGDDTYIAGMCSVSREIINKTEKTNLLGFKESCLLAPAESSVWTRFFEVHVVNALSEILNSVKRNIPCNDYPLECVQFENHLNEPVRAHNIYKLARKKANAEIYNEENGGSRKKVTIECKIPKEQLAIDHTFAEGVDFTIADLILYPLLRIIFHCLGEIPENFPLTIKWLNQIDEYDNKCRKVLYDICHFDSLGVLTKAVVMNIPKCNASSLYKSDPKRYKPRNRIFTEQTEVDAALNKIHSLGIEFNSNSTRTYGGSTIDWEQIEPSHATSSALPLKRLERKREQLQNLANAVASLSVPGDRIVDFCSGTGHLGILLALQLPQCTVILLENKPFSLQKAKERAMDLKLKNLRFYQSNIDYFNGNFNIGCSLHACGTATDIVLSQCRRAKAKFVSCPCCYGSLQPMPHIKYPLSKEFKSVLTENEFLYIAHAADQGHALGTINCPPEIIRQGQLCMDIVDTDRKLQAESAGYKVTLTRLRPENCTPKNRLLVGNI